MPAHSRRNLAAFVTFLALVAVASPGFAEEATLHADGESDALLELGVGARIGGYGFRHADADGTLDWEACRMNGVGIYTTLDVGDHFFTELSLDVYHTIGKPTSNGIDRLSAHSLVAVGARFFPDWIIVPNVHLGGGVEWSAAEIYGTRAYTLAPIGFIGAGGELALWDELMLGMTIRSHAMPLPEYDWETAAGDVRWKTEIAGQMLFSARYVF